MKMLCLKRLLCTTSLILALPSISRASAESSPGIKPAEPEKEKSYFLASLLPMAFQSHPLLAISVITEMTDLGKKLPLPTTETPAYYVIHSMGYQHEGHDVSDNGKVSEENIQKLVQSALARSHYLPTDNNHPATIVLFYFWGIHSKLDAADKETGEGGFKDVRHKNLLSRALLVGGAKFVKNFAAALQDRDRWISAGRVGPDPLYLFSIRTDLNRNLVEQVMDNCYYVVISAYDADALFKGERKLLWRTKMSTPAQGVSLAETTPALVASGGPYFGREMNEPSIVDKRINRKGNVGMGELKVIEMDGKAGEQPAAETPAGKK